MNINNSEKELIADFNDKKDLELIKVLEEILSVILINILINENQSFI
jgi:hypothetical protein